MSILTPELEAVLAEAMTALRLDDTQRAISLMEPYEHLDAPAISGFLGTLLFSVATESGTRERGLELMRRAAESGDGAAAQNFAWALRDLAALPEYDVARRAALRDEAKHWFREAKRRGFPVDNNILRDDSEQ
jgi:hypothetical protein